MADFTSSGWGSGATVNAYARDAFGNQTGAAVANSPQTANAAGQVTFSGLADAGKYVATDGSRTVRFGTPPPSSSGSSAARSTIFRGAVPVATRGNGSMSPTTSLAGSQSDGIALQAMHRLGLNATTDCGEVRLAFGNYSYGQAGPNDIYVTASLEASGLVYPVFFNGMREVRIQGGSGAGGHVISDPAPITLAKAAFFCVRTFVRVANTGEKWPLGSYYMAAGGDGISVGGADTTMSTGSIATGDGTIGYAPVAIVGTPTATGAVDVALWGDSVMIGIGDRFNEPRGWAERALNRGAGYVNLSRHTERTSDALNQRMLLERLTLAAGCSRVVTGFGANDVNGGQALATIQANMQSLWNRLSARGLKVYAVTVTPWTTSTDAWATTGNQTVTANEATRTALNDWLRTKPSPLTAVFETADTVESARNSGRWKAGYTSDGIHPNQTGHPAMAPALTVAGIT